MKHLIMKGSSIMQNKICVTIALLSSFISCTDILAEGTLPPPPFELANEEKLLVEKGWVIEHIAFTLGNIGQPVGGPARWAVGGVLPTVCTPAEQSDSIMTYDGSKNSNARLFISDQRRRFWILEKGEVWPIAGCDDLGLEDGPGPYARFLYEGVYGGGHGGMVAAGYTLYVNDCGRLRKIQKQNDGSWMVTTVAGTGKGEPNTLASLKQLGKGLTIDKDGNLYFCMNGGLMKASPDGKLSWVITREKVQSDLAEVYAKKWPEAKVPSIALGQGESVSLVYFPKDGSIYGGGRTWPSTWKVTANGTFVPLINYAPKDKMLPGRWGRGDPACYEPHCCMGWCVTPEGYVIHQNEIPWAVSRYEFDKNQVSVLCNNMEWVVQPPDYKDFFRCPSGFLGRDVAIVNAPGPFHTRSALIRYNRIKK